MRTLIIPDIHQQIEHVDELLERESGNYDRVTFLGDYFDSYDDSTSIIRTANWLKDKIENYPDWTLLLGNHDCQYLYDPSKHACSGFQRYYRDEVYDILSNFRFSKFKLYEKLGTYYLTHGGIYIGLLSNSYHTSFDKWIKESVENCFDALIANDNHFLLYASRYRGGFSNNPGFTWCDWNELIPIDGINQIVGHTRNTGPVRIKRTPKSTNYCIDGGCTLAAIHDDSMVNSDDEVTIIDWMKHHD